jgi:hypothetical protein
MLPTGLVPDRLNVGDDQIGVWCVPSATHVPRTHRSENKVRSIRECLIPYYLKVLGVTFIVTPTTEGTGLATRYLLDGPWIESRWGGEIFHTRPDLSWGPPNLLYKQGRI